MGRKEIRGKGRGKGMMKEGRLWGGGGGVQGEESKQEVKMYDDLSACALLITHLG